MEREFSFSEFMTMALLREEFEERHRKYYCPESTGNHNAPDPQGRCSWCGRKYTAKKRRDRTPVGYVPEDELSYRYQWDPDFGNGIYDKYP